MTYTRLAVLAGMALASIAVVACGDDDDEGGGTTLSADLKEFSITLDRSTLPAGDAEVTATNTGSIEHEFVLVRTPLPAGSLPVAAGVVDEEQLESQGGEIVGEIEEFAPGSTETGTFNLEAAQYVVFCNLPGHYEQGMRTVLTVQ